MARCNLSAELTKRTTLNAHSVSKLKYYLWPTEHAHQRYKKLQNTEVIPVQQKQSEQLKPPKCYMWFRLIKERIWCPETVP